MKKEERISRMAQAIEIEKSISVFKKMADKLALEYLKATLEEAEGQRIECYDEQGEPIGYEFCVTYDGGRHPEYDANPFSDVKAVFLKGDEIFLDTEDCEEYSVSRLDYDERVSVARYVYDCHEQL